MGSAVVIAPKTEQRKNLEQFLQQLPRFASGVEGFGTFRDASSAIARGGATDVVFISEDLGKKSIQDFISYQKDGKFGKRICFIGLCGSNDAGSEKIGELLAAGVHGILKEPITYNAVEDALSVSKSFKNQGTKLRLKTAAGLFLSSAVDKLTAEQGLPTNTKDIITKVRDACKDYKRLTGESLTLDAVRPSGADVEEYTGISKRVREIYELRLKSLIGRLFKAPG